MNNRRRLVIALGNAVRSLMRVTKTIPIVMSNVDSDPVQEGIVASLARPGGNVTGLIGIPWELASKCQERVVKLANEARLPAVYSSLLFSSLDGLMAYAPNTADQVRRAAVFVDKILKGAIPGDLPVEQPTRSELVVNLKTAKALKLTIPQTVLVRADRVIQ